MNFLASFPRKLSHKVEKKGTRKFPCKKKRACKDTAKLYRKKNQNPRHEAIFAPLREALRF